MLWGVVQLAHDVAQGLAYLHPSVVHRDLKPSNIMLDQEWPSQDCRLWHLPHEGASVIRMQESCAPEVHPVKHTRWGMCSKLQVDILM